MKNSRYEIKYGIDGMTVRKKNEEEDIQQFWKNALT